MALRLLGGAPVRSKPPRYRQRPLGGWRSQGHPARATRAGQGFGGQFRCAKLTQFGQLITWTKVLLPAVTNMSPFEG